MLKVLSKLIDKEIFDVGEGVYQYNIVGVRRHWGGGGNRRELDHQMNMILKDYHLVTR